MEVCFVSMPLQAAPQGVNLEKEPSLGLNQGEGVNQSQGTGIGLGVSAGKRMPHVQPRRSKITDPDSSPTCYHLHHWDFLVWVTCVLESVPRNLVNKPILPPHQRPAFFTSHNHTSCQHKTGSWFIPTVDFISTHYSATVIASQAIGIALAWRRNEQTRSRGSSQQTPTSQRPTRPEGISPTSGCLDITYCGTQHQFCPDTMDRDLDLLEQHSSLK